MDYVDILDTHIRIKDVYSVDGWQLNQLYISFEPHLSDIIKSFDMVLNDFVADCFIWKENIDGNYTAT